jgi:hypothetical protein
VEKTQGVSSLLRPSKLVIESSQEVAKVHKARHFDQPAIFLLYSG